MKQRIQLLLCLLPAAFLLASCRSPSQQPAKPPTSAQAATPVAKLFADYYEERLKLHPMEATMAGDERYNDLLPNQLTEANRAVRSAFYRKHQAALARVDRRNLSDADQMNCDILAWDCAMNLTDLQFPTHLLPVNQFECLHLTVGQWAGGTSAQPFKAVRDYENWLHRLDGFKEWCGTAMENMRRGAKAGYVLPKALTLKTIPQFAALAKLPVEEHTFYSPIKLMPASFSPADRERLTKAYTDMIQEKMIPTFRAVEAFLTKEYLPACRESSGISAIPNGREFYQTQIRKYTTTDLTAEEIFQLGEREVSRLLNEMETVKRSVGFQGELKQFFEHLRTRKELMPFTEPQQVLENFQAIRRKMSPQVAQMFRLVPKTPLEIRRTEAFREETASAEWMPGSLDGTRPGIFYVPIPNVKEYSVMMDESLFLHEAIPGHHYQLSLQQENTDLPMFRRVGDYSAFSEGWALYCESLGKELGLYQDPYQYFGMLSMEMHRAIRLVVDSGLHSKGWTREQAIQYSLNHEAAAESEVISEIERYMSWPGQALAYKVGQLKIRELRARAEKTLGARFDIRDFHEQVLGSGSVPLKLLEQKIDRWIQSSLQKSR